MMHMTFFWGDYSPLGGVVPRVARRARRGAYALCLCFMLALTEALAAASC
jgi:hypothetical protein